MPRPAMLSLAAAFLLAAALPAPSTAARPRAFDSPVPRSSVFQLRAHAPRAAAAQTSAVTSWRSGAPRSGATSVPDGAGGTYVVWVSDRDGATDIYLQRVTASGDVASGWPATGLAVCTAPGYQLEPGMIPDGAGGVIVGWADFRDKPFNPYGGAADLYTQRVTPAGVPQWMPNGVLGVAGVDMLTTDLSAAPDGLGGAFLAWASGFSPDVYVNRIDVSGTVPTGWSTSGVVVCNDPDDQYLPVVAPDGIGGCYVVWEDTRTGEYETYAQRLNGSGVAQWGANGQSLTGGVEGYEPTVCVDGGGGMIAFWITVTDIVGQRYNSAGTEQWTTGGVALGASSFSANELMAWAEIGGGALLCWRDPESGNTALRAQRVNGSGVAQWSGSGVTLCGASGDRYVDDGFVDGGGLTLLWEDTRSGAGSNVYLRRVDAGGTPQWTADGVLLSTATDEQRPVSAATDGAGGTIVTWVDYRTLDPEPYAQRVNAAGVVQLAADGKRVVADPGRQRAPLIAPDGAGGAWVAWHEKVSGDYQVRAKRLDSNGAGLTGTIVVCGLSGGQFLAGMVPDGASGVVLAWEDYRGGSDSDIYAQRLNGAGVPQWTADGLVVCNEPGAQYDVRTIPDGAGSMILAWTDERFGAGDIYAQRLNGAGAGTWGAGGLAVCAASGPQSSPVLAPSGTNGAVIAWVDARSLLSPFVGAQRVSGAGASQWTANGEQIATTGFFFSRCLDAVSDGGDGAFVLYENLDLGVTGFVSMDLMMQRVNAAGSPLWGTPVSLADVDAYRDGGRLVTDGADGAIAAWNDARDGDNDIYAQRVGQAGFTQWLPNGVPICDSQSWQWLGGLVADGAGGARVTWSDERFGQADIYVQRITPSGSSPWNSNGVLAANPLRGQYEPALAMDGDAALIAWTDFRNGTERLVYAQKHDINGAYQWGDDGVTSTLFSMVGAEAGLGRVRVTWAVGGAVAEVTAYRRSEGEAGWTSLGPLAVDGVGRVVLEDASVVAGSRYAYRIGMVVDGAEVFSEAMWIEVPNALALAIERVSPQPARGDVYVTFSLPVLAPARLEVLDVAGRRVGSRELLGFAPGRHVVRVDEVPEEAGVYFVRVWQGGESVTGRVVRVR